MDLQAGHYSSLWMICTANPSGSAVCRPSPTPFSGDTGRPNFFNIAVASSLLKFFTPIATFTLEGDEVSLYQSEVTLTHLKKCLVCTRRPRGLVSHNCRTNQTFIEF